MLAFWFSTRKSVRFLFCPSQLNLISSKTHFSPLFILDLVPQVFSHSEHTETAPRRCVIIRIATMESISKAKQSKGVSVILKYRAIPFGSTHEQDRDEMSVMYGVGVERGIITVPSAQAVCLEEAGVSKSIERLRFWILGFSLLFTILEFSSCRCRLIVVGCGSWHSSYWLTVEDWPGRKRDSLSKSSHPTMPAVFFSLQITKSQLKLAYARRDLLAFMGGKDTGVSHKMGSRVPEIKTREQKVQTHQRPGKCLSFPSSPSPLFFLSPPPYIWIPDMFSSHHTSPSSLFPLFLHFSFTVSLLNPILFYIREFLSACQKK